MLKTLPLTLKMLVLTALVGVTVWTGLDYLQTRELRKIFQDQLAERLSHQAQEDRIRFDRYVKSHHKTVKLLVEQRHLIDYLAASGWFDRGSEPIVYHRRPPRWLPKPSILRELIHPRYALLIDGRGNTREVYYNQPHLPAALLRPDPILLRLSRNQAYLTAFNGIPYIVACENVRDDTDAARATLMLATPIDDQSLATSQSTAGSSNIVALLSGTKDSHILVSNNLQRLPPGTALEAVKDDYLVTGQAFFDYGDSELAIRFASFISTAEVEKLTGAVLTKERQQRAITALAFIGSLGLIMFWITQRIQRLTHRVTDFSTQMNLHNPETGHGDQLSVLEERFQSLTEQIVSETAALEHQALHDPLTNLPNRTLLHDRLQQAILGGQRDTAPQALLVMDLDHFKEINDTLGHHIGDLLLEQVSARLSELLRKSDTVARLGGDEFAVLLPDADVEHAKQIAEKIIKALNEPFVTEGHHLGVGISIGIVQYPLHGEDANTLIQRADVAMYVAKRTNSGFAVYDPKKDRHSLERLALMSELRSAIDLGALELHFQPKVCTNSRRTVSIEALVRWRHPDRGFIAPIEFIPLAEQTGLIRPLDLWVVNEAMRQLAEWQEQGQTLSIAVNLSVRSLHDLKLPNQLAAMIDAWDVPPSSLIMEVTESAIMADPLQVRQNLVRLDAMGLQISIDDFGTGYSSLAYLKQLPVDEIKIDRSFITHMTTDENDAIIVRATIELAHNLGLRVVAEGVETKETLDLLTTLRCDTIQGYFICRPLPATDVARWLEQSRMLPCGDDAAA